MHFLVIHQLLPISFFETKIAHLDKVYLLYSDKTQRRKRSKFIYANVEKIYQKYYSEGGWDLTSKGGGGGDNYITEYLDFQIPIFIATVCGLWLLQTIFRKKKETFFFVNLLLECMILDNLTKDKIVNSAIT